MAWYIDIAGSYLAGRNQALRERQMAVAEQQQTTQNAYEERRLGIAEQQSELEERRLRNAEEQTRFANELAIKKENFDQLNEASKSFFAFDQAQNAIYSSSFKEYELGNLVLEPADQASFSEAQTGLREIMQKASKAVSEARKDPSKVSIALQALDIANAESATQHDRMAAALRNGKPPEDPIRLVEKRFSDGTPLKGSVDRTGRFSPVVDRSTTSAPTVDKAAMAFDKGSAKIVAGEFARQIGSTAQLIDVTDEKGNTIQGALSNLESWTSGGKASETIEILRSSDSPAAGMVLPSIETGATAFSGSWVPKEASRSIRSIYDEMQALHSRYVNYAEVPASQRNYVIREYTNGRGRELSRAILNNALLTGGQKEKLILLSKNDAPLPYEMRSFWPTVFQMRYLNIVEESIPDEKTDSE